MLGVMQRFPTDRVLGGKEQRLGVREKEAILAQVLAEVRPKQRRAWLPIGFAAAATAAALLVLFALPQPPPSELTPRGAADATVEITCHRAGAAPCRVGDRLYFRMLSATPRHLAAFAKNASGEIVWFFPQDETATTRSAAQGFFDEAPILPPALAGDVTVHILLTDAPLTRAEVRATYDHAHAGIERSLHIDP
jgi:hypothetical protein